MSPEEKIAHQLRRTLAHLSNSEILTLVHARLRTLRERQDFEMSVRKATPEQVWETCVKVLANLTLARLLEDKPKGEEKGTMILSGPAPERVTQPVMKIADMIEETLVDRGDASKRITVASPPPPELPEHPTVIVDLSEIRGMLDSAEASELEPESLSSPGSYSFKAADKLSSDDLSRPRKGKRKKE